LKEELFQQSDVCSICGQKIAIINDAALDHELEYWRGGQTVPENDDLHTGNATGRESGTPRVLEPTKLVYLSQVFQAAFWII